MGQQYSSICHNMEQTKYTRAVTPSPRVNRASRSGDVVGLYDFTTDLLITVDARSLVTEGISAWEFEVSLYQATQSAADLHLDTSLYYTNASIATAGWLRDRWKDPHAPVLCNKNDDECLCVLDPLSNPQCIPAALEFARWSHGNTEAAVEMYWTYLGLNPRSGGILALLRDHGNLCSNYLVSLCAQHAAVGPLHDLLAIEDVAANCMGDTLERVAIAGCFLEVRDLPGFRLDEMSPQDLLRGLQLYLGQREAASFPFTCAEMARLRVDPAILLTPGLHPIAAEQYLTTELSAAPAMRQQTVANYLHLRGSKEGGLAKWLPPPTTAFPDPGEINRAMYVLPCHISPEDFPIVPGTTQGLILGNLIHDDVSLAYWRAAGLVDVIEKLLYKDVGDDEVAQLTGAFLKQMYVDTGGKNPFALQPDMQAHVCAAMRSLSMPFCSHMVNENGFFLFESVVWPVICDEVVPSDVTSTLVDLGCGDLRGDFLKRFVMLILQLGYETQTHAALAALWSEKPGAFDHIVAAFTELGLHHPDPSAGGVAQEQHRSPLGAWLHLLQSGRYGWAVPRVHPSLLSLAVVSARFGHSDACVDTADGVVVHPRLLEDILALAPASCTPRWRHEALQAHFGLFGAAQLTTDDTLRLLRFREFEYVSHCGVLTLPDQAAELMTSPDVARCMRLGMVLGPFMPCVGVRNAAGCYDVGCCNCANGMSPVGHTLEDLRVLLEVTRPLGGAHKPYARFDVDAKRRPCIAPDLQCELLQKYGVFVTV